MVQVGQASGEGGDGQGARQRVGELEAGEGLVIDLGQAEPVAQFLYRRGPGSAGAGQGAAGC